MGIYLEYKWIFSYLLCSVVLALIILALSYFLILKQTDLEKISVYECGFDPFSDARGRFDVRFYLVSILFIIFDLEITFLFPWAVTLSAINLFGYITMMLFLFILLLGFVYEWKKGPLDWE